MRLNLLYLKLFLIHLKISSIYISIRVCVTLGVGGLRNADHRLMTNKVDSAFSLPSWILMYLPAIWSFHVCIS